MRTKSGEDVLASCHGHVDEETRDWKVALSRCVTCALTIALAYLVGFEPTTFE